MKEKGELKILFLERDIKGVISDRRVNWADGIMIRLLAADDCSK
jgi:hypothetical protein